MAWLDPALSRGLPLSWVRCVGASSCGLRIATLGLWAAVDVPTPSGFELLQPFGAVWIAHEATRIIEPRAVALPLSTRATDSNALAIVVWLRPCGARYAYPFGLMSSKL